MIGVSRSSNYIVYNLILYMCIYTTKKNLLWAYYSKIGVSSMQDVAKSIKELRYAMLNTSTKLCFFPCETIFVINEK